MAHAAKRDITNLLLQSLLSRGLEGIRCHLEHIELHPRQVIYQANVPIDFVYFINQGLVSRIKTLEDGKSVEVGQ